MGPPGVGKSRIARAVRGARASRHRLRADRLPLRGRRDAHAHAHARARRGFGGAPGPRARGASGADDDLAAVTASVRKLDGPLVPAFTTATLTMTGAAEQVARTSCRSRTGTESSKASFTPRARASTGAPLLKRTFDVDLRVCVRYGGKLTVRAVFTNGRRALFSSARWGRRLVTACARTGSQSPSRAASRGPMVARWRTRPLGPWGACPRMPRRSTSRPGLPPTVR